MVKRVGGGGRDDDDDGGGGGGGGGGEVTRDLGSSRGSHSHCSCPELHSQSSHFDVGSVPPYVPSPFHERQLVNCLSNEYTITQKVATLQFKEIRGYKFSIANRQKQKPKL